MTLDINLALYRVRPDSGYNGPGVGRFQAVLLTEDNLQGVADWTGGQAQHDGLTLPSGEHARVGQYVLRQQGQYLAEHQTEFEAAYEQDQ